MDISYGSVIGIYILFVDISGANLENYTKTFNTSII